MLHIGFVGLGHMGLPMATHLVQAGFTVTGYDQLPQAIEALCEAGGKAASSLQEAALDQQVMITMLQTGQQVREVCLSEGGLFASARPKTIHIDCSSIDVASSRDIHQQALGQQIITVDAPVSGGVAGAKAKTLTFMVGGSKEAYQQAKPILEKMGKNIIYAGLAGNGQTAKICNNMILGVSMVAVSEAFVLANRLGLDAKTLQEIVSHSSGQCWVMDQYVPVPHVLPHVPAEHDYQPGFTAAMMLKDLLLSQNCAQAVGVETPVAACTTRLYQHLNEIGLSDLDFSAIIKTLQPQ